MAAELEKKKGFDVGMIENFVKQKTRKTFL